MRGSEMPMLLQFKVKNFQSIKDEAILSMVPSTDRSHPENLAQEGNREAIKTAAIYGANAAGKSAVIRAFVAAIMAVRTSDTRNITQKIPGMVPFKFDEETAKAPCSFEFFFVANDGIPYRYGFTADSDRVQEEYLYFYTSARASRVFERTGDEFDFNQASKSTFSEYEGKNTSNKFFLATATNWGNAKTAPAYQWLANAIDVYNPELAIQPTALQAFEQDEQGELKQFTLSLLRQADINIDELQVDITPLGKAYGKWTVKDEAVTTATKEIVFTDQAGNPVPQGQVKTVHIHAGHHVQSQSGEGAQFFLDLNVESLGTRQLFWLSPILKEVFEKGKTMVIDELDRSLHPFLVKFLVELFHNPNLNQTNAQLIFTTYDTTLLSLDTFRRDQIYFVEKDPHTAATELYSLDEFSVRKNENIEKGYLLGRYGAVPYLRPEVGICDGQRKRTEVSRQATR